MTNKFAAAIAAAKEKGPDMTKAVEGGGEYTPPAAGPVQLRFVAYIETGKHERMIKGQKKVETRALLGFELSGPKHPPKEDGTPHVMFVERNLSLNVKATFQKDFTRLNYAGKATHIAELLGNAYLGEVFHRPWKGADGKDNIAAELHGKGEPIAIKPPRFDNPVTGETTEIQVLPARTPLRLFMWDFCDKDQWDSLFIDGMYEARKDKDGKETRPAQSKNRFQNKIKLAKNFPGSPIYNLLATNGVSLDIPDPETGDEETAPDDEADTTAPAAPATPTGAAATDALNGIV